MLICPYLNDTNIYECVTIYLKYMMLINTIVNEKVLLFQWTVLLGQILV